MGIIAILTGMDTRETISLSVVGTLPDGSLAVRVAVLAEHYDGGTGQLLDMSARSLGVAKLAASQIPKRKSITR